MISVSFYQRNVIESFVLLRFYKLCCHVNRRNEPEDTKDRGNCQFRSFQCRPMSFFSDIKSYSLRVVPK